MNLHSSLIFFIFSQMQSYLIRKAVTHSALVAVVMFAAICIPAQPKGNPANPGKTVFYDSDGNQISNNEFVDIRMANFHLPDRTLMRTLEDGTVEFRLQKVPQEGMRVPDFSVQTLDGKAIRAADLSGKVVVLNFWFIGCPVCLAHKPMLNELKLKFAGNDDVVFLAMTEDPAGSVKGFLAKEKFTYLHAANAKAAMDMFGFTGYPKNIVISRSGEVVYWRSTIKAWDKFESVIRGELDK